ncbi:MAG TPA: UbiD family decarboxylase [bacterium]|nr:UbiD family decarboxylase [bacterium]
MRKYYRDLREFLQKLEEGGLLRTVQRPINKDLELMPVVRWQFRGNLPESARKAFLFKNVTDGRGNKYSMPVLVGGYAASRNIYALGMMCSPEEIAAKWNDAQMHPVKPILLETGPVHEEVHLGAGLLNHGGIGEFPVPVSTPGLDNAPYLSNANWVTKDPETGERNLGNYRAMIKSATRTGVFSGSHLFTHWKKCRAKGIPLQAAVVIGASPNIIYVGAGKPAYGTDEYAVAGGIAGEPVELVRCKTVDLEVPATAEIVFEGEIPTDSLEREAPFGEYTGYMGMNTMSPYFNVTCITHRRDAIYSAFISQFPPSESSVMRGIGREAAWFKLLRHDCNIAGVLRVAFHQTSGSGPYAVIQMKKYGPGDAWQALHAAYSFNPPTVKFIIAVDEDIDPGDPDSVNWAMSFRVQPHRDIRIVEGRPAGLDVSAAPPDAPDSERAFPSPSGSSAALIDATRKFDYPPVALPRQEYMERARKIWEEEGWEKLNPKVPWHGYPLGYWTKEQEEEADLAIRGEYYRTGTKLEEKERKKL